MQIRFAPNEPRAGVCSFAFWDDRDLQEALRKAFHTSPREELTQVDVARDGVWAYFESRDVASA